MSASKLTAEQGSAAVAMYEGGASLADVAGAFGLTRQAMWERLRRRTQMRPQLRYGADNHFHRGGVRSVAIAHDRLEKAVLRGRLQRPNSCEQCGQTKVFRDGRAGIHAHHDDYSKPLEVRWLCQPCHHAWHATNTAKGAIHADR